MAIAAGVLLVALLTAACGGSTNPSPSSADLTVVTTTTVFADFVAQVGGERVAVHPLVPKGADVHTFDPAPSDAARLESADMLVMNGMGVDDWLLPFAQQAGAADIPLLRLAEGMTEVDYIDANPHLWLDPDYAAIYVDQIRLKLIELDPVGQQSYDANAAAYDARLAALDDWARQQFDRLPAERRRLVSFHDAFPYFAAAYDLEIVDVLVDSPGQDPSPAEVARVVQAIRAAGVSGILAEAQFSDQLAQTIAAETGAQVISDLYTDSLGDAPVDTYEGALRWDVERIAEALQ